MNITDFYFRFDDKEIATVELGSAGFYRATNGELTHDSRMIAVDEIGVIQKPTGERSMVEGELFDVLAPIHGHHINIRSMDDCISERISLIQGRVHPLTAVRVWA